MKKRPANAMGDLRFEKEDSKEKADNKIKAETAAMHFFRGTECMAEGNAPQAETSFRQALLHAPQLAEAHANLALLLEQRGAWAEAETSYLTALRLNPDCARSQLNFGAYLATQKRFADAEQHYLRAIALYTHDLEHAHGLEHPHDIDPSVAAAWSNLGVLYACMQRETEAEACYRKALQADANYANARYNLSYLLLRLARFEEGWACLEARPSLAALTAHMAGTPWQGQELQSKSLLIVHEGGHGDMLQFCRYAALLKQRGAARISVLSPPALQSLLASLDAVDEVVGFDASKAGSDWDYWVALFSLPHLLQTRLQTIPAQIPYLQADPKLLAAWQAKLPAPISRQVQPAHKRVGLVWKGSPKHENDADRSLHDFSVLAPLWQLAHIHYISLQKDWDESGLNTIPNHLAFTHLGADIADFSDMAAIVQSLDLLISVDSAAAHLAGALGKPCWILLPAYKSDWRWLAAGSDTPWYPRTTRLFRQPKMGDWAGVIEELIASLRAI